jgi:hypothetical protein
MGDFKETLCTCSPSMDYTLWYTLPVKLCNLLKEMVILKQDWTCILYDITYRSENPLSMLPNNAITQGPSFFCILHFIYDDLGVFFFQETNYCKNTASKVHTLSFWVVNYPFF